MLMRGVSRTKFSIYVMIFIFSHQSTVTCHNARQYIYIFSFRDSFLTALYSIIILGQLLYIDNLEVPKPGFIIDRLHTPRIQLYTKELVEAICQEDRVKDERTVFGQLNFNGILASCYSHPDYDKDKEPHGDNAGTPFADELITAAHISFPSMFHTIGPHLSGLQAEQKKRALDALGKYDRQAKICAENIAKNIRTVQTCHARVSDHIVSIIRGDMRPQETAKFVDTSTDEQPTCHGEPDVPPSYQQADPQVANAHQQSTTPLSTAHMERHVHTAVDLASTIHNEAQTGGTVLPLLQKPKDLVILDGQQQAAPCDNFVCDPNDTIAEDIQDCHHVVEQTDTPHIPASESHQAVVKHVGKASQPEMAANIPSGRINDACRIRPATPCPLIPLVDVIPESKHNERISQVTGRGACRQHSSERLRG